jgi:hypothetical protein
MMGERMKLFTALFGMMLTLLGAMGCAHPQGGDRPPSADFGGTLSERVVPASVLGPEWRMEEGLMIDDISQPTTVPAKRRAWAQKFLAQRRAAGARSYGEVFYFSPENPPVKVSTLILVYQDADKARAHWNESYGPGQMTGGYNRTNQYGDKSVENRTYDELVVLAGNVIIQASQPVKGNSNDLVLQAYLKQLAGLEQPANGGSH